MILTGPEDEWRWACVCGWEADAVGDDGEDDAREHIFRAAEWGDAGCRLERKIIQLNE